MSRAQSVSEYSICVVAIILAVIVMQSYIRRGLAGRYYDVVRHTAANIPAVSAALKNKPQYEPQYEPYYLNEDYTTDKATDIEEGFEAKGKHTTNILQDKATRNGTSVEEINSYKDK